MGTWAGYSISWLAVICARVGKAARAHAMLKLFADAATGPNSLHLNGDTRGKGIFTLSAPIPTPEGGFAAAGALLEMLLQSWNGTLRIFPATPDAWGDAAFDNLRAEGAFLVSARRRKGRTTWVRIESEAGARCRLHNPFRGPACLREESSGRQRRLRGNRVEFATRPGERYTLTPWGRKENRALPGRPRRPEQANWYGLKEIPRF
jgi:hypothetical protein